MQAFSTLDLGFLALVAAIGIALFWALRGAVPGRSAPVEEEVGAPSPSHRDRFAGLATFATLLIFAGPYVAARFSIPLSVPLFVLGFGLNLRSAAANRRFRHDSPATRRIVAFLENSLTAWLLGGVLVIGNVLAFKYAERPLDLTRERVFTLESLTINQLKSLSRPVKFTAFFGNSRKASRQLDRVQQLLDLYRAENPSKVSYDVVTYGDPLRFEDLVSRFPDAAVAPGGVAIEYGEGESAERLVVRNGDMFEEIDGSNPSRSEATFRGEDALTSALVRLRQGVRPRLAFLTGHGETPLASTTPGRPSLGRFKARLEALGMETVEVDLTRGPIPPDCTVALCVASKSAFRAEDIARLSAYQSGGGRLILLLDDAKTAGLDDWLKAKGIAIAPERIVDPSARHLGNPYLVSLVVGGRATHPIVSPLINREIVLPIAAPVSISETSGVRGETLLSTTPETWAETDFATGRRPVFDGTKDRPGPLGVAVAISEPAKSRGASPTPSLLVIGSPGLADDYSVTQFEPNLDLLVNGVNWLRGRPDLQGLAPRRREVPRFTADTGLQSKLVVLPTLLAIGAIATVGVTVYLARRA